MKRLAGADSGTETVEITEVQVTDVPKELILEREERQVVVHCRSNWFPGVKFRIWPQNFLVPRGGGKAFKTHSLRRSFYVSGVDRLSHSARQYPFHPDF